MDQKIIKKFEQLDQLREQFESFDLQLTKDLNLPSLSVESLFELLDSVPASGTRMRIARELQNRGKL